MGPKILGTATPRRRAPSSLAATVGVQHRLQDLEVDCRQAELETGQVVEVMADPEEALEAMEEIPAVEAETTSLLAHR